MKKSPTEERVLDEVWPIIERIEQERADRIALEGLKKVAADSTAEQMPEDLSAPAAEA